MKQFAIGLLIIMGAVLLMTFVTIFFMFGYMPYLAWTTVFPKKGRDKNKYRWVFDLAKNQFTKKQDAKK